MDKRKHGQAHVKTFRVKFCHFGHTKRDKKNLTFQQHNIMATGYFYYYYLQIVLECTCREKVIELRRNFGAKMHITNYFKLSSK